MLNAVFEPFVTESPISVMSRDLMEGVLAPEALDRIFEANTQVQYTRELLFSDLVNLMSLVVCGIYPGRECCLSRPRVTTPLLSLRGEDKTMQQRNLSLIDA